jgi:hypothetical protein
MSCVAIKFSYRLNVLATRSLAIDHVSETAQGAVKARGGYERVARAEFDVDRFPEITRVIEEKIGMSGIKRVYSDELEALGR